ALVHASVDLVDVDAGLDQLRGHPVGPGAGVLVHEPPGVGDQSHVQCLGDLQRGGDPEAVHQVPHDLGGAGGVGHDQVHGAEMRVVVVMVDVEDVHAGA